MGVWGRHVLPRLLACGCCQPAVMERRAQIVPRARGAVMELGCGAGANFQFYQAGQVSSLTGVEPAPEMIKRAGRNIPVNGIDFILRDGSGENLPFADCCFDTVVTTFTLCSVGDPAIVLAELRRVLRPDGSLLFLEHGLAPNPAAQTWQHRIEPIWKRVMGNCHLTRPVISSIRAAGFDIAQAESGYMRDAPKFAGWTEWGEARLSP